MYCRMCGNKVEDTDHYCQHCGTPTGYREQSAPSVEEEKKEEEIVFNPPYEPQSHFIEEDPPFEGEEPQDTTQEDEILKEFISESEIKEEFIPDGDDSSARVKNSEFTWNLYEFPGTKAKKTEDIDFNWNLEDYGKPEPKESEASAFEKELFQEIQAGSERIKEQNIDRFFTFSRKNEEFQKLLDREYEKFKAGFGPDLERSEPESTEVEEEPVLTELELSEVEAEPILTEPEPTEIEQEPILTEPEPSEAEPEESGAETEIHIAEAPDEVPKAEHLSEMAQARAQFFGEELICDNESIRKKLSSSEPAEGETSEELKAQQKPEAPAARQETDASAEPEAQLETAISAEPAEQQESAISAGPEVQRETLFPEEAAEKPVEAEYGQPEEISEQTEEMEGRKRKGSILQILLVIIAIILAIEIVILGIRFFAPQSAASEAIGIAQTRVYNTISGWIQGIGDLFSGEDAQNQDNGEEDQNIDQEEESAGGQTAGAEDNPPAPDPNPAADRNALVASQLGHNKNIQEVKASEVLVYHAGKDYGQADINNSKPIANNIWLTPENGEPVYYDQAIVGAIIAYDSQWIDYVNNGDKSVLGLLKKDSKAYRNAVSFSKLGKITETFKLLEIGEIRQGSNGFYVWAHEEIQITEKGAARNQTYNYIYYLEPVEGKMQIVNYFNFNN